MSNAPHSASDTVAPASSEIFPPYRNYLLHTKLERYISFPKIPEPRRKILQGLLRTLISADEAEVRLMIHLSDKFAHLFVFRSWANGSVSGIIISPIHSFSDHIEPVRCPSWFASTDRGFFRSSHRVSTLIIPGLSPNKIRPQITEKFSYQ